jgi:Xaa-Pro aminopeptidase
LTSVKMLWLLLCAVPLAAQSLPPPPEPVAGLPGAGRPVDIAATATRRAALLRRLPAGFAVVPAATLRDTDHEVVQDNDFRQDDDFFYLTELETPDAVLLLAPGQAEPAILFLPPRVPEQEVWTGLRLGPGPEAARLSGISAVLPLEALDSVASALVERTRGPVYTVLRRPGADTALAVRWARRAGREVADLAPVLDSLRVVKDEAELQRLRRAVAITVQAHREAMRALKPGLREYQVEAIVEYTFRNLGADRVGFPSIVASGPNATTLHYDVNRRTIQEGDLVVLDIGAEYGQYTADVTRTLPASGRFSPRQRAVYDLVLATQQATMEAVRPGTTIRELNAVARRFMREHSGGICGAKPCDAFFVHGVSHWLGMRVHDVGDYNQPLVPGMVLTIEPGIYLPEEALGVRIEDDVLVTPTGFELLSSGAPRTAAEIEAMMRRGATDAVR